MIIAEISALSYFLSPTLCLACAATLIAFMVGTVLALGSSSRGLGRRVLVIAPFSVAVELVLLIPFPQR